MALSGAGRPSASSGNSCCRPAGDFRFDITGSSITLENFRVRGAAASAEDARWSVRLQLDDTQVRRHKPMHIDTKAEIVIGVESARSLRRL
jgi:hypothetical protein